MKKAKIKQTNKKTNYNNDVLNFKYLLPKVKIGFAHNIQINNLLTRENLR